MFWEYHRREEVAAGNAGSNRTPRGGGREGETQIPSSLTPKIVGPALQEDKVERGPGEGRCARAAGGGGGGEATVCDLPPTARTTNACGGT